MRERLREEQMSHYLEIVFVSASDRSGADREALARLRSFAEVPGARFRQRRETVDIDLADWNVTIEHRIENRGEREHEHERDGGARRIVARHREWPGYRVFSSTLESGRDIADWIASDDALAPLDGIALETRVATELECVEWEDLGASKIRATLCSEPDRPDTLSLIAPFDARDALFELAREVLQDLPFLIAPYAGPASDEPVKATKLALPKHTSANRAFFLIGSSISAHWFCNHAAARHGLEAEHVHQLRVAQRRLKTALKLFPDLIDDAWRKRVATDLQWFGDLLSDARDWDVFTDTTVAAYASSDDAPASWQAIRDAADKKRMTARRLLSDALRSPRYARLALSYVEWLSRWDTREDNNARPLADHARRRIRKHYRKIARSPDLTTLDPQSRHRVRIHAKRLRYALEFFHSIVTRHTRRDVEKQLGKLQGVLGDGNDAAVAAQRLFALPEAEAYQKGLAKGFAVAAQRATAAEGERILRKIKQPRIKASL
jgi:CHAD domain-containing protein